MAKTVLKGNPYENLANTIIFTAVEDYRKALSRFLKYPDSKDAQADVSELERFFRSRWYSVLTSVEGESVLRKIRAEYDL